MSPEKRNLFNALMDAERENHRQATLRAGGRILRRRRWRRFAFKAFGMLVLLGLAWFSLPKPRPSSPATFAAAVPKEPARSLTDEELLAMFPDTPVALATLKDGKKRLILLRPGDEERFLRRF